MLTPSGQRTRDEPSVVRSSDRQIPVRELDHSGNLDGLGARCRHSPDEFRMRATRSSFDRRRANPPRKRTSMWSGFNFEETPFDPGDLLDRARAKTAACGFHDPAASESWHLNEQMVRRARSHSITRPTDHHDLNEQATLATAMSKVDAVRSDNDANRLHPSLANDDGARIGSGSLHVILW